MADYLIQALVTDDPDNSPPMWEDVCVAGESARQAWERYETICKDNGFDPEGLFRVIPVNSIDEVATIKVTKYDWRGTYRDEKHTILPPDDSEFERRLRPDAIKATIGEPEAIGNDEVVPPRTSARTSEQVERDRAAAKEGIGPIH